MKRFAALFVALASLTSVGATHVRAQDTLEIPPEIMEMITGDISTIHMDVMQATIVLQPGQAGTFWTIYDEYLQGVRTLTQERTELVRDYALAFEGMTDGAAADLGRRAIGIEQRRTQLLADYFDRVSDALGGRAAAQFMQIENRIATLKDLRLMMELPIIGE